MLHISFALYVVSLLSSVLFLSALWNNPKYRCTSGFNEFIVLYSIITAFICITAVCLYLSVNVSTGDALRQHILKVYLTAILVFLGLLPIAIEKYNSTIYQFVSPSWFLVFLRFNIVYAIAGTIAIWWLSEPWYGMVIGFSIGLFLIGLLAVSLWARQRYDHVFKSGIAKVMSRIMITQSLCLPLLETVFWSEHISKDGFTFSLPVIYLVNNVLLWVYRDELMPGAGQDVSLRDMESLLSPKEQEIARALAQGLSNKQIAAKLGITQSTVKNHIYSIFKKCDVTNRVALINYLRAE